MLLGNRSQAHSSVSTDGLGHGTTGVYLSRPISEQVGDYGYGLQLEQSRNGTGILSGRSQYRSRFGEAGIEAYGGASQPSLLGTFDGAIVMGGGHFALGNTIQDSFALVDVGIPNVPVYLQNREVTRTGPGGEALVPGLSSYRSNRVSIRLEDLPDSPASGVTAMDVVPARKAGSFVNLNENISLGGTVVLKTVSGALLAPGTEVHFNDSQSASYVGYDGLTYFMGVKATNTVSARRGQVECSGQFARPPAPGDADPLIVVCQ